MDQLSSLLHDYSILTRLSCMSQMVPVKSEHIYIFVCYSASCPPILLHSGRRRGAFLGEVHPPLPLPLVAPAPPKTCQRKDGRVLSPGLAGSSPSWPWRAATLLRQQRGTVSWHGFSRFPVRRGMFSVLSAMRAIKKVQVLKRS